MKMSLRWATGLLLASVSVLASAFPDKPVRMIVPYPAGGPVDAGARIIAERLARVWNQSVVVENRPGASGALGTDLVIKSKPDGYTLLVHSPVMIATELTRPSVGYRGQRDLVPISLLFSTPFVLVAHNDATRGGLKEVLASGATKPGELSYGSHGEGTTAHYFGERLSRAANVPMIHVPYAGEAPILTALMGGHVKMGFISGIGSQRVVDSGKGRILAISSRRIRSPLFDSLPTMAELGFPGFDRTSWAMVMAPVGTPAPVVEQIARDIDQVAQLPEIQQRFTSASLDAWGGSAADAKREFESEYTFWASLIREVGNLAK